MGRGQWYRWSTKATTDSQHRVDIRWMRRHGYLRPGMFGSLTWYRGEEKTGSIRFQTEPGQLILLYNYRPQGRAWEQVEENITLDATPCHYGGFRLWFLCPHCTRRVAVLYGAGKLFLCRHCYNLSYSSQREALFDRQLERARSIRKKLGGGQVLSDPFPWKPKRMQWRTYWKLRNEAKEAEAKGWTGAFKRFGYMEI